MKICMLSMGLLLGASGAWASGSHAKAAPVPSYQDHKQEVLSKMDFKIPKEVKAVMDEKAATLAKLMPNPGLKVGVQAPDFKLKRSDGTVFQLSEALASGPVVLNFYRGGWCLFCNMEHVVLKQTLPLLKQRGASLASITPQTFEESQKQVEKMNPGYPLLSDESLEVIKAYGLYFDFDPELAELYKKFNIDLLKSNGGHMGMTVPATVVIGRDGRILAFYAKTDYTKRMEPAEILKVLDQ